jgi:hypothetical protein
MAKIPIPNASGSPAEDSSLAGAATATAGQWMKLLGQPHVNAIVRVTALTATVKLEGSMDAVTVDGELLASVTVNSTLANRVEFAGYPFVRLSLGVVAAGEIDQAFIYGYGAA